MKVLIIHPSFPGQFLYLAEYLAKNPENEVVFLSGENPGKSSLPRVRLGIYKKTEEKVQKIAEQCGPCKPMMESMFTGLQTVKSLQALKRQADFVPDVVIGHTGWGSLLYIKDVYPDVPVIGYFE